MNKNYECMFCKAIVDPKGEDVAYSKTKRKQVNYFHITCFERYILMQKELQDAQEA